MDDSKSPNTDLISHSELIIIKYFIKEGPTTYSPNIEAFLKQYAENRQWQIIPVQTWEEANFIWRFTNKGIEKPLFMDLSNNPIGLINQMFNHTLLTHKDKLFNTLYNVFGKDVFGFIPYTFVLEPDKNPSVQFIQNQIKQYEDKKYEIQHKTFGSTWWITKPVAGRRGSGINIYKDEKELSDYLRKNKINSPLLIQKYLENPMLYKGRKFELRIFTLVMADQKDPSKYKVFMFNNVLARISNEKYSLAKDKIDDSKFIGTHVTNFVVQGVTEDVGQLRGYMHDIIESFIRDKNNNIEESKIISKTQHTVDKILKKLSGIFYTLFSGKRINMNNIKSKASFQLIGYDFMLDNDLNPWIIEMNGNPDISFIINKSRHMRDELLTGMFDLIYRNRLGEELISSKERNSFSQIV